MVEPSCIILIYLRDVIHSPAGNGLDTHGTWEAILSGCIPIVPHSPLDAAFAPHLPVWLVDDWSEVTDEAVRAKSEEVRRRARAGEYNLDRLFTPWWEQELRRVEETRQS